MKLKCRRQNNRLTVNSRLSIIAKVQNARLKPISNATVKAQVASTIREAIFSGKIGLGEALRELHLARELCVSQASIREGLHELEVAGLVVRTPNVGTRVTTLTSDEIRDRLQVRVALEVIAAVGASQRAQAADFVNLEQLLANLSGAIKRNAYYEASQADLQFHRYIWNASGNRILARTLDQIATPLFAFTSILRSKGVHDLKRVVHSHDPILAALRGGESEEIREVLQGHFEDSYDPFLNSGFDDCDSFAESLKVKRMSFRPSQKEANGRKSSRNKV
jgi:DNA-binding GntR family transcriptional regulator